MPLRRVCGPLALELENLIAMTSSVVIDDDCVGELDLGLSLTWATVVDFSVSFWSLLFLRRLLSILVRYGFSVNRNPCCKVITDVAGRAKS